MYELFEHTADIGIRARAAELNTLFEDAARGLFAVIVADSASIAPIAEMSFQIAGHAHEDLLFDWLAELLYTFETRRTVFSNFEVHFGEDGLTAIARGEPIDQERHQLEREVKAITYHGLKVQRDGDGWLAEVIVDI
jgi:SHS2 domain-containing protein